MTDFQPKNLNELESYLEKLALREGPVCFALFKSIQRIGHLSSPDVLEYVRIAQTKMAEAAEFERLNKVLNGDLQFEPLNAELLGYSPATGTVSTVTVQPPMSEPYETDVIVVRPPTPLAEGDDERTLPGDPLPIAGNPLSGAEHPERGPDRTLAEMTPAQQRAARARAARQANLAARRSA